MNPKTALQNKVVRLSRRLSPITEKQASNGYHLLGNYVVRSRKSLFCLECGHSWREENSMHTDVLEGCECTECGKCLKLASYRRSFDEKVYYGIMTVSGGMQVIRIITLCKNYKKNEAPSFWYQEVMQHWISEDGKITTMALKINGMSPYYDQWVYGSDMEIRQMGGSYNSDMRFEITPYEFSPRSRVLSIIKRNGYNGNDCDIPPHIIFSMLLKDQRSELLMKTKRYQLLNHRFRNKEQQDKFWPSIMICIRNNYEISNISDYMDYLRLLEQFGKDLHNSHYVCPSNLKKEHDRYVKKMNEINRKKKLEEQRKLIAEREIEYNKGRKKYFGIAFGNEIISVKVLQSVQEFFDEGQILHHCVFSGGYYSKKNSLVLSARIDNKPVETIEVLLSDMKISQSRGILNNPTEFHDQIISLVNNNLHLIRKASSINVPE